MKFDKIAIVADDHPPAMQALNALHKAYQPVAPEEADIIVALGGDGAQRGVIDSVHGDWQDLL